jgi:hypothetical protein
MTKGFEIRTMLFLRYVIIRTVFFIFATACIKLRITVKDFIYFLWQQNTKSSVFSEVPSLI